MNTHTFQHSWKSSEQRLLFVNEIEVAAKALEVLAANPMLADDLATKALELANEKSKQPDFWRQVRERLPIPVQKIIHDSLRSRAATSKGTVIDALKTGIEATQPQTSPASNTEKVLDGVLQPVAEAAAAAERSVNTATNAASEGPKTNDTQNTPAPKLPFFDRMYKEFHESGPLVMTGHVLAAASGFFIVRSLYRKVRGLFFGDEKKEGWISRGVKWTLSLGAAATGVLGIASIREWWNKNAKTPWDFLLYMFGLKKLDDNSKKKPGDTTKPDQPAEEPSMLEKGLNAGRDVITGAGAVIVDTTKQGVDVAKKDAEYGAHLMGLYLDGRWLDAWNYMQKNQWILAYDNGKFIVKDLIGTVICQPGILFKDFWDWGHSKDCPDIWIHWGGTGAVYFAASKLYKIAWLGHGSELKMTPRSLLWVPLKIAAGPLASTLDSAKALAVLMRPDGAEALRIYHGYQSLLGKISQARYALSTGIHSNAQALQMIETWAEFARQAEIMDRFTGKAGFAKLFNPDEIGRIQNIQESIASSLREYLKTTPINANTPPLLRELHEHRNQSIISEFEKKIGELRNTALNTQEAAAAATTGKNAGAAGATVEIVEAEAITKPVAGEPQAAGGVKPAIAGERASASETSLTQGPLKTARTQKKSKLDLNQNMQEWREKIRQKKFATPNPVHPATQPVHEDPTKEMHRAQRGPHETPRVGPRKPGQAGPPPLPRKPGTPPPLPENVGTGAGVGVLEQTKTTTGAAAIREAVQPATEAGAVLKQLEQASSAGDRAMVAKILMEHEAVILQAAQEAGEAEAKLLAQSLARAKMLARIGTGAKVGLPVIGTAVDIYFLTKTGEALKQARKEGRFEDAADLERQVWSLWGTSTAGAVWAGASTFEALTASTGTTAAAGAAPALLTIAVTTAPILAAAGYKIAIDESIGEWKQSEKDLLHLDGPTLLTRIEQQMTARGAGTAAAKGDTLAEGSLRKVFTGTEATNKHYQTKFEKTDVTINRSLREKAYLAYFMKHTEPTWTIADELLVQKRLQTELTSRPDLPEKERKTLEMDIRKALIEKRFLDEVSEKRRFIEHQNTTQGTMAFSIVPPDELVKADDYAELRTIVKECTATSQPPVLHYKNISGDEVNLDLSAFSFEATPTPEARRKIRETLTRYREEVKIPRMFEKCATNLSSAESRMSVRKNILHELRHYIIRAEQRISTYYSDFNPYGDATAQFKAEVVRNDLAQKLEQRLSDLVTEILSNNLSLNGYRTGLHDLISICEQAQQPKVIYEADTSDYKKSVQETMQRSAPMVPGAWAPSGATVNNAVHKRQLPKNYVRSLATLVEEVPATEIKAG